MKKLKELKEEIQKLEKVISEAPIGDFDTVGDFNKASSFRSPVDRKIITSPKGEAKIRKIWQNAPGTYNLAFINTPKINKPEFTERGVVDEDFVRNKMGISPEELQIDPSAATIIFTNNKGDERVMSSGWILAHRFGHAIAATERGQRRKSSELAHSWNDYVNQLQDVFRSILSDVYDIDVYSVQRPGGSLSGANEAILKLAAQQLGTMKSARDSNLRTWYEFAYELFAQYLLTGKIRLNALPDNLVTKVRGFVKQHAKAHPQTQEMYNRHDLDYYAKELESLLDNVIESTQGKIFVM